MMNIFISYRRSDSLGHAGRLFDGLSEHFGADHVFMDVSDLLPGQDYVDALDQALAKADCVLAVIGPRWLDATGAAGQRRIDDPEDLVCREIAAGLKQHATVIPVLVHGAAMPTAAEMPPALSALARRQAIVLTDQRWERDLDELVRLLGAERASPPLGTAGRSVKWVGVVALLALVFVAVGAWIKMRSGGSEQAPITAAAATTADKPARTATNTVVPSPQRYAIALPKVSEVRFRTHRAQFSYSILAIRQEPRDAGMQVLSLLVRMTSRGPADDAFSSDQFRLIVGDRLIASTTTFHGTTYANSAEDKTLDFVLPGVVAEPSLEIRVGDESTRLPIGLSVRSPIANDPALDEFGRPRGVRVVDAIKTLPAVLAAGQRVEVGKHGYQIVDAVIERETMERASLTLTVRCSVPRGGSVANFWSDTVRLWVDGVPRKPVNSVNVVVGPGYSKDERFVFDFLTLPDKLEVGIVSHNDSAKVALSLEPLLPR